MIYDAHLGLGTYTSGDAARLAGVTPDVVRRWAKGYQSVDDADRVCTHPPVWEREYQNNERFLELGFRDLMELRAIAQFRSADLSWRTIRRAHQRACRLMGHRFPFSTSAFFTDGFHIFVEASEIGEGASPTDVVTGQAHFAGIVNDLRLQLDFGDDKMPERWWPIGRDRQVVIDPRRTFGTPIVSAEGVPTRALKQAIDAGDSRSLVAKWYGVSGKSLRDAIEFESKFAA